MIKIMDQDNHKWDDESPYYISYHTHHYKSLSQGNKSSLHGFSGGKLWFLSNQLVIFSLG